MKAHPSVRAPRAFFNRPAAISAVFLFLAFCVHAQNGASYAAGIWENASRVIEFTETGDGSGMCRFVLKTYYGWFFDDAASLPWRRINADDASGPGVELKYPGEKRYTVIPLYIEGDSLYLDFWLRGPSVLTVDSADLRYAVPGDTAGAALPSSSQPSTDITGFWRPGGSVSELGIALPRFAEEVTGFYISPTHIYRVRYWLTDASYDPSLTAVIRAGADEYAVSRFVRIGERTYTCTEGRSALVRSSSRTSYIIEENKIVYDGNSAAGVPFFLSSDRMVLSFSQPYLTKSPVGSLDAYIAEHNAMRKPPRKPPL